MESSYELLEWCAVGIAGKVLALQTQGLEFNPQNLHEKLTVMVCTSIPVLGRWSQEGPGNQLSYLVSSKLKNRNK